MKQVWLIMLGMLLSQCAAIPLISGVPIQARDVISTVNTVNNLQKYSTPAAREELETRVKRMARSRGVGAEAQ